jgi:hypothetical protein
MVYPQIEAPMDKIKDKGLTEIRFCRDQGGGFYEDRE